ncbi:CLC_0170 family protein [Paenibacillus sp. MMO-58]|uniref:CLC_0170 family protein n=1 Tax=Paenibacillus sp. MMO-58 TaxID=3081290 RepID=UPI003FA70B38
MIAFKNPILTCILLFTVMMLFFDAKNNKAQGLIRESRWAYSLGLINFILAGVAVWIWLY